MINFEYIFLVFTLKKIKMKIEDISIFGEYKQAENRVTAAFLQICKVGGEELIRFVCNEIGIQLPSSEIDIHSQVKGDSSTVLDGLLQSNFSFELYVESKIKPNAINTKQLGGHLSHIEGKENAYLLYLTPDNQRPESLNEKINWASWLKINYIFNNYISSTQSDSKELLEFLVNHFETLLSNLDLLKTTTAVAEDVLAEDDLMVLAGAVAEGVALNYNYYICQARRFFRPVKYIAFYNRGQIRYVFRSPEPPKESINLREIPELEKYLLQVEPNYKDDLRKVFKLEFVKEVGPILNDTTDKNGRLCPFTYGQPRYTKLSVLEKAKKTSELI
jgi:hypothetical protein